MNRTIAAIATSLKPSAIGVIRMTGNDSIAIASKVLKKADTIVSKEYLLENTRKPLLLDFGHKEPIDKILFLFFQNPNSYTGEDLCEFSFHGNPILLKKGLEELFTLGAVPAEKGEFTKRAYLNGKLDISSAEAIGRIISARSKFELELSQKNYFGELSRLASRLRSELINVKAEIEAEIDFSTEDLTYESIEERKNRIQRTLDTANITLNNSEKVETMLDKTKIVIYGEPNTGKSSLMNLIIGRERAIVSDIPGTTRDFLSEELQISGIPIQLVDTAGIRETTDKIERLGIERSEKEINSADLRLILIDASKANPLSESIISKLNGSILIANKIDTKHESWNLEEVKKIASNHNSLVLEISCITRQGIIELEKEILSRIHQEVNSETVLLEDRNKYNFKKIVESLSKALELMDESTPAEIYVKEIEDALIHIGNINGKVDTEEVLGRIFSKFCVGK
ncbi:MAG: tRNA uridine-5-carboxymethylaminomethyl(34) synthesis GTPase MnmE [Leptospiraceae bacterium]|nr:tRNA uridine-5-carboxymethylaminomethyl(34) synthesis GTPase MnmE [Leptospiraceae bacterium]